MKPQSNNTHNLWVQLIGVGSTVVYSFLATFLLWKIVDMLVGLRVREEEERAGLDITQHGESIEYVLRIRNQQAKRVFSLLRVTFLSLLYKIRA